MFHYYDIGHILLQFTVHVTVTIFRLCMCTLSSELRVARTDLEAMKKQAESTNAEYDRLAEEHQKLQVCNLCTGLLIFVCVFLPTPVFSQHVLAQTEPLTIFLGYLYMKVQVYNTLHS